MKNARLPLQILALFLHVRFAMETLRLHLRGYVIFFGETNDDAWTAMLATLAIVTVCETISLVEAILFAASTQTKYAKAYLVMVVINAGLFITMAYYTTPGTVVCMASYAVLLVLRVINLVFSATDAARRLRLWRESTDTAQQLEQITALARKNQSISRQDVMRLLGITGIRARFLLRRLLANGTLRAVRGEYYTKYRFIEWPTGNEDP